MKVTTPISDFLKVSRNNNGNLALPAIDETRNHIGTAHAGAQFVLAEMASGACLKESFPEYADRVIAVVRRAEVKYSKPGETELEATASITGDPSDILKHLTSSGRGLAVVDVQLFDNKGQITFRGKFTWFLELRKS